MSDGTNLEKTLETIQPSSRKIALVDTAGNITYSLLVGSFLDYSAGLNAAGIFASRATGTAINSITGGLYGWWREQICRTTRTTKESSKLRRTLIDLLAFNTFQVPAYAVAITLGNLVSEGEINMEKIKDGTTHLITISPLIGPTLGLYLDGCRKIFGVQSAAEGAYSSKH